MALPLPTRALQALGYSLFFIKNNPYFFPPNFTTEELTFIEEIVANIEALDLELIANTKDSMAVKVDKLELDYNRYIGQTLALQNRYREKLSDTIGVKPFTSGAQHSTSLLVRSYY